jgi:hypothetical protein
MTARDIEIAVANFFNYRVNIIVPNVSWGFFSHMMEADLIIIRPSGWAVEIEIKTSASDIKRDTKKKRHQCEKYYHPDQGLIQRKYFAVPTKLSEHPDIPDTAGILAVDDNGSVKTVRPASINKYARKLTPIENDKLLRLGCMRIWTLKEALNNHVRVKEE